MKNIFKSVVLFFACWMFTNTSSAQLASDAPSPAKRINLLVPEIKVVNIPTASSAAPASVVKSNTKVVAKKPTTNPAESQGKEVIIKPASDTLTALPPVSFQTSPAKKSD